MLKNIPLKKMAMLTGFIKVKGSVNLGTWDIF